MPTSLIEILQDRAQEQPDTVLYRFLNEDGQVQTLTYYQLFEQAKAIAADLQQKNLSMAERIILIYPPGLELIAAYMGCLLAGVIAVPVYPPLTPYLVQKLQLVLHNSQANHLLTTTAIKKKLQQLKLLKNILSLPLVKQVATYYAKHSNLTGWDIERVTWITTDNIPLTRAAQWQPLAIEGNEIVFLQYTSGSTGDPKGVMLSHHNLIHNLTLLKKACLVTQDTIGVNWVPPYHDMGLIGAILLPIFAGCQSNLMSPLYFLKKPYAWLKAIMDYQATTTTAPDFAFDFCVKKITSVERSTLDLSSWKIAINGAEPIHVDTLERFYAAFKDCGFQRNVFFPCYGLAEATLLVSAAKYAEGAHYEYFLEESLQKHQVDAVPSSHPQAKGLVSCGYPVQSIYIVDPKTNRLCQHNQIGEIWIHSPSVAKGYWQREVETERDFHAHIIDDSLNRNFLRTGDLGFLYQDQLYVTGRIKDLIIIRGLNFYPQDIELTVKYSHPDIRKGCTAAFTQTIENREHLIIVTEIKSTGTENHYQAICEKIADNIFAEHELQTYSIALLSRHVLPKTTSGKLRRRHTKELYEKKQLPLLFEWCQNEKRNSSVLIKPKTPIETELCLMCSQLLEREVGSEEHFSELGVDSLLATQLISRIRDKYELELPIQTFFECHNITELAQYIVMLQKQGTKNG